MAAFDALQEFALHHAHRAPDEQGTWSRVWPLLLTALLTVLVLWCVQFYMVPKVETRKRREDRWEQDLLKLGELLTFEFEVAISDLRQALSTMASLEELKQVDDVDLDRLEDRIRASGESLYAASDTHRSLRGRISWLTERIIAIDPNAQTLLNFRAKELGLSFGGLEDLAFSHRYIDDVAPTREQIAEADKEERKMLKELIDQVTKLAAGKPVRASTRTRRATRRIRSWLISVRANGGRRNPRPSP